MDHEYAVRIAAVEKYLLNELPREEQDGFEEHFFDCAECAQDLRAGILLLDQAKMELGRYPIAQAAPQNPVAAKPRFWSFLGPAFAVPVFAMLFGLIAYQNLVVLPHLHRSAVLESHPQILQSLSLAAANSRGEDIPSISTHGKAFLLLFDIPGETPGQTPYTEFLCSLYSPSGKLLSQTPVSVTQAKDTISLRVPAPEAGTGIYRLEIEGLSTQHPTALASYRFRIGQYN